jgi:SAM-dependent methyltransferase
VSPGRIATHDWDWWAYQFRVVHRRGIEGIEVWDRRLLAFIRQVLDLKAGERVLDLAAGSGIHAQMLARRGLKVVGLDVSPSLMCHATAEAVAQGVDDIVFVLGDMRALPFAEAFDALVMLSTSFGLFDGETNLRILADIARVLKPGGRLLLQLQDPFTFAAQHEERRRWEERPEGIYWTETWFDPTTCTHHAVFRFTDNDGVTHLWHDRERIRVYTLPELRRRFERAGLALVEAYGDIELPPKPYGHECHKQMIVVGRTQEGADGGPE